MPLRSSARRLATEEKLGPVDILLAFAEGQRDAAPVDQTTEDDWRSGIDPSYSDLSNSEGLPSRHERAPRGVIVAMVIDRRPFRVSCVTRICGGESRRNNADRHSRHEVGPMNIG